MTYLTYFDSAEGEIITRARTLIEFKKHGTIEEEQTEFFSNYPNDCNEFDAQDVLIFLGY